MVERNFIHPQWLEKLKDHPFDYDYQLLELSESLILEENIQPIKIARIEDMIVGSILAVTGWGHTFENVSSYLSINSSDLNRVCMYVCILLNVLNKETLT